MSKTANPTKKKSKATNKRAPLKMKTFQEERDERMGIRIRGIDDDYLRDLGDELIEWAQTCPDKKGKRRISLERFYIEKCIAPTTMDAWRKRMPYLDGCVQFAKLIIGSRLEEGIFYKELHDKPVMHVMHDYLDRWNKANKYHDDRKNVTDVVAQLLGKTFENVPLDESNRETTDRDTTKA